MSQRLARIAAPRGGNPGKGVLHTAVKKFQPRGGLCLTRVVSDAGSPEAYFFVLHRRFERLENAIFERLPTVGFGLGDLEAGVA
jgi:hypothetical protein